MRILIFLLLIQSAFAAAPVRVLIFSGRNNHDWRSTTPYLQKLMQDTRRFDVRVTEMPQGITAKSLETTDLLVLDYCGPRWGDTAERAVLDFVNAGKGVVVVHAASYPFGGAPNLDLSEGRGGLMEPPWAEYRKMVGAYWSQKDPPITGHGPRHSFEVKFANREHPIAKGMGASFIATDELYANMRVLPGIEVIATAGNEPMLWTNAYGKGRVFHTALGHNLAGMKGSGFVTTFLRGAEWAATGAVTLPAMVADERTGVRLLVVTGGHAYETSFYTLFDGMRWDHAATNLAAFAKDIRPKYDVVLFYDLSKEIGEKEKKNLVDFAEAGKGLVVLHHALADYNNWEWWWRDLVGVKYDLEKSTYKEGIPISIMPAMRHPVVGDVGAMLFNDEAYKGMYISKDAKVLFTTDSGMSDGPVAWISPYEKSRVVVIQTGHGREAHMNEGFRTLIKNAIRWAGTK
jgi:type 1 glutamine amidotransferase